MRVLRSVLNAVPARGVVGVAVTAAVLLVGPTAAEAHRSTDVGHSSAGCRHQHSTTTLTTADNGRRICVHRGQQVSVALSVDPDQYPDPSQWWSPVMESGSALQLQPQTAMPARGTTLARYKAVTRGRATLSSTRRVCASTGGVTCHSIQSWSVTVVVR